MVFGLLKKFHNETMKGINEEWENEVKPLNLHKEAFEFLQKEFGAFQFLNLNSDSIKNQTDLRNGTDITYSNLTSMQENTLGVDLCAKLNIENSIETRSNQI